MRDRGVQFDTVTLHVGLDTFRPVESVRVEEHAIHSEWAVLTPETARHVNEATLAGGRVVAVGTTSVRTLEWGATGAQGVDPYDLRACPWQRVAAFADDVRLFIYPGYRFRAVDVLLTNFHLPRSSLLMLVSAFIAQAHPADPDAGRRILLEAYETAKAAGLPLLLLRRRHVDSVNTCPASPRDGRQPPADSTVRSLGSHWRSS